MLLWNGIDPSDPGPALEQTLAEVERYFKVRITVHDCQSRFFDARGESFFHNRHFHTASYCLDGRYETPGWDEHCKLDCAFTAEAIAHQEHKVFLHRCWKGVTELIVPVEEETQQGGSTMLLFYAGPFRAGEKESAEVLRELPESWVSRWRQLPCVHPSEVDLLARILLLIGHGMLHYAAEAHRDDNPLRRRGIIRKFLYDHAHEAVNFAALCRELALSPSRTRAVVALHFGVPFHRLLETERMIRAEKYLAETEYPLKEIAEKTGYVNEYHFNRTFRRHFGMPPGEYRRRRRSAPN
ncbi:MAG: AraC family transcriptional regulator [Victivallaceae bacterium]|nr:AraC family transcriptional regulator [Victivallaceae bacterium]